MVTKHAPTDSDVWSWTAIAILLMSIVLLARLIVDERAKAIALYNKAVAKFTLENDCHFTGYRETGQRIYTCKNGIFLYDEFMPNEATRQP